MKKGLALVALVCALVFSAAGYSVEILSGGVDEFKAPIVTDKDSYTNTVPFGTILYDNTDQAFVGLDNAGSWATFAQSTANFGEVFVHTGNATGTANNIRRFATPSIEVGSDITYADPSTGGTFTINNTGLYAISYTDGGSSNVELGVSVNASALNVAPSALSVDERPVVADTQATYFGNVSTTLKLQAGDIVRAHVAGTLTDSDDRVSFRIARVR